VFRRIDEFQSGALGSQHKRSIWTAHTTLLSVSSRRLALNKASNVGHNFTNSLLVVGILEQNSTLRANFAGFGDGNLPTAVPILFLIHHRSISDANIFSNFFRDPESGDVDERYLFLSCIRIRQIDSAKSDDL
jgi:hypothetical protein